MRNERIGALFYFMRKLCGIDSSTNRTAISYFEDDKLVDYKVIDMHKITDKNERIDNMMLAIGAHLNMWNPDFVYQEDTWTSGNPETANMLTTIIGGVRFWCLNNKCGYHKIKPSVWRSQFGLNQFKAKRQELKEKSIEYVKGQYGVEVSDDEADAILIGLCGTKMQNKLIV